MSSLDLSCINQVRHAAIKTVVNVKNWGGQVHTSLYEVCFHTSVALGIYEYAKYLGYEKFHIPNCLLCKNYVDSYSGTGKICRYYKHLQIPRFEDFDTSRAKDCSCYTFNQEEYEQYKNCDLKTPFDEV